MLRSLTLPVPYRRSRHFPVHAIANPPSVICAGCFWRRSNNRSRLLSFNGFPHGDNDLALSTRRPEEVENLRSPDGDAAFFRRKAIVPLLRGSSVGRIDLRLVWRAFSFDHRAETLTRTETVIILRLNDYSLGPSEGL